MLYRAVLVCSDDDCAERQETIGTLAELEAMACECGCGLLILGWPDPLEPEREAEVVQLRPPAGRPHRIAA